MGFVLALIPAPWSIFMMGGLLVLYWIFFNGSRWSQSTSVARKERFRQSVLLLSIWATSLLTAVLFVVAVQSGFMITFRILEFPDDLFTQFDLDVLPLWLAWLYIVMAALVAGVCEEVGFRGYMQVPLEKHYGPKTGITIVSVVFLLSHLNQAWLPPILIHVFAISIILGILAYTTDSLIPGIIGHTLLDVIAFSYIYSDILGSYEYQTIYVTGIDFHFISWALVFTISLVLFFLTVRRIKALRYSYSL
jgi:membrane protease YdiL (CAAX protease family)